MQLGLVTSILYDLSLEDVFAVAASEGYDCVELQCWPPESVSRGHGGVCHLDVVDFSQERADGIRALADKHGVGISALGYYPNPLSNDSEEAAVAHEHLSRVIEAAPLLGLATVNTFIGADPTQPLDVNLSRFAEVWPDKVFFAEERGVRLAIENCPMYFEHTWPFGGNLARSPEIWERMFDAIPSPNFGLNIDPSHLVMQLMDEVQPIYDFGSRIFHAHAKDMKVDRRALARRGSLAHGWAHAKIPGLGDVDWGKWISALTDIGYDGPVCVEVEDDAFSGDLETRRRSLRISERVLRPLIA